MEIKCMHCGEGWDVTSIHDISTVNNIVGGVVTTAGDVLGDDIDGIAVMLEDYEGGY